MMENLRASMGRMSMTCSAQATLEFRELCKKTHERFETSGDEFPPFTFAGFNITSNYEVPYTIDQTFYIRQLEELDLSASYPDFRSMRMRLAWLSNTRPELQFEISQLARG